MKKIFSIIYLTTILCTACASTGQQYPSADNTQESLSETDVAENIVSEATQNSYKSILNSYYSSKSSPAFEMFKKSIFKNLLDDWVDKDIENLMWNYDSFTQYHNFNNKLESIDSENELYYCTFSADNNIYGYIVMSYDGSSLQRISVIETLYLYDLQANIDKIVARLGETEIDLSSAVASRVNLVDADKNSSSEVILFTDDSDNNYACYLDTFEIVKIQ